MSGSAGPANGNSALRPCTNAPDGDLVLVTDDPQYKLDNGHKAYYATLIMAEESDLTGVFDVRQAPEADERIKGVAP